MSFRRQRDSMTTEEDRNKAFVLEAFDVLFNKGDYGPVDLLRGGVGIEQCEVTAIGIV
jgi:hypothetical protein